MGSNSHRRKPEKLKTPLGVSGKWWLLAALCLIGSISIGALFVPGVGYSSSRAAPFDLSQATYVGRDKCIQCHANEVAKYQGSHHDLAMDRATPQTVLGDFSGVTLEHHGITSRMFRDGDKFMINTEGPDGQMHDYQIQYVFGVTPLQQYMVEFDGDADGKDSDPKSLPRVQVLRVSWDTLAKKWFHLDPPDVSGKLAPNDDLHWTGIAQRWNNMCADCHSTNLQKGFDHQSLKYHTTFSEIDVSCEACHGPASKHLELAEQWFPGWNRQRGYGLANLKKSAEDQIQACSPCHSRRGAQVATGFKAGDQFYDHFADNLLTRGVYYPDGQVLDEDYIHGSFIQSKMYHKGIRCTDCHDPHTARLKHDGNQVCTSCHQHPTAKYDSVAHHFHKAGTPGASCVNCHMPPTTYMAVDPRHDHSLRIPRPDLSLKIGTPNACTGCHLKSENLAEGKRQKLKLYQDWMQAARDGDTEVQQELERANRWCDEACDKWYGERRRRDEHFGEAIAAGQQHSEKATSELMRWLSKPVAEVPAIARATLLQTLSEVDVAAAGQAATTLVDDPHPLVRSAACDALLGNLSLTQSAGLLASLLNDPVRLVRTSAARNLLQFPPSQIPATASSKLRQTIDEIVSGVSNDLDRAGAHLFLASMAEQEGRLKSAIDHYRDAIRVEPQVTGARTNLAALLEAGLQAQFRESSPPADSPIVLEVEKLRSEELDLIARDVQLLPTAANLQYAYGKALYLDGQKDKALGHLIQAAELEPHNFEYAQAVTLFYKAQARWPEAEAWAMRMRKNAPLQLEGQVQAIMVEIEKKVP